MTARRKKSDISTIETIGDHKIPFYRVTIEDGSTHLVPKYITRIFTRSQSGSLTRGWQIKFIREDFDKFRPFFNDYNGSPDKSLGRAIGALYQYLGRTPNTRRSSIRVRETKSKAYATGLAGIRITWRFTRRTNLWEAQVDVRVGKHAPNDLKTFYLGTENTVSEERLQSAIKKGLAFRRDRIASKIVASGASLKPLRGRKPKATITIDKVYDILQHIKKGYRAKLDAEYWIRAGHWIDGTWRINCFRGSPINRTSTKVRGYEIFHPDFIELDNGEWVYEFRLADDSLYGGSLPVSWNPQRDIQEIINECFLESVLATKPPQKDRLYPETSRYASMPLKAIEAINNPASASN